MQPGPRKSVLQQMPLAGPFLILIAALCMLAWSWGTWPDPLVDFGAQLYVPWQICSGRALYRDIAYFNGPLSSYLNALGFLTAGVSVRTIVWMNLAIIAAMMVLTYRLTERAASRGIAILGGMTFVLVFAFGQTGGIGNYNWITPYTHELTHGTALGLAAIASAGRFQRTGKKSWMILTSLLLGCVFLTKAEPAAATFAAVGIQLSAGWWLQRSTFGTVIKSIASIVAITSIPLLFAWALLSLAMPWQLAFRGVMGSWLWVFDRRVTSLNFYQMVTGFNDIRGNVATMLYWSAGYAVLLVAAIGGAFALGRKSVAMVLSFFLVLGGLCLTFKRMNWMGMLAPLPLCMGVALLCVAVAVIQRRLHPHIASLRFSLLIFSIVLLAKMGLRPHVYHYGFVLAWPGTIVLLSIVGHFIPNWISARGGIGGVVKAVGLACWIVAVFAVLNRDAINFSDKRFTVAPGTSDSFVASTCGKEVQEACDEIHRQLPTGGTVAVFPQGLMINYLTRRPNPIPNVNFMPPEVLAAGETNILRALDLHPPDLIVLTSSAVQNNHFALDGRDDYGASTLDWIKQHYQPVRVIVLPHPLPTIYRFVISRRR